MKKNTLTIQIDLQAAHLLADNMNLTHHEAVKLLALNAAEQAGTSGDYADSVYKEGTDIVAARWDLTEAEQLTRPTQAEVNSPDR